MTAEKPEVRLHVELGPDQALAIFPTGLGNFADAVEHQHRRQRQLCIARAKQLAAGACQQILVFVTAAPFEHGVSLFKNPDETFLGELDRFWLARAPILTWLGLLPPARTSGNPANWRLPHHASRSGAGSLSQGLRGAKHLPANGQFYHAAGARP